jgi:thioredoxin 1
MRIHDLATESDLVGVLDTSDVLLIDFWSPACPPCRAFAPVFEAAAERHPGVAFCRVNTQEEEELSSAFDVEHVPSLVAIRDRVIVASQPGYLNDVQLDDLVTQIGALDMDVVRSGDSEKEGG